MTGLDKMVDQILEEAKNSANECIEKANAQAESIKKEAEAEAAKLSDEISAKSKTDVANYKDRIRSNAELNRRNALLAARQGVISETIEKAYDKFCSQSTEDYFSVIKKMIEIYASPEKGMICFSEKDMNRLPSGFAEEVKKIAQQKGGDLELSEEVRDINGGFVLVYGGIEENCSFRALFDSKMNDLQDLIQKEIFS